MRRWLLLALLGLTPLAHGEVLTSVTGTFGTFANATALLPNQVYAGNARELMIYTNGVSCTTCSVRAVQCCGDVAGVTCATNPVALATAVNPTGSFRIWDSQNTTNGGSLACVIGVDSTGCSSCTATISYRMLK